MGGFEMKLWMIRQIVNTGYDTYDSAIVAADTEEEASMIHPDNNCVWHDDSWYLQCRVGESKGDGCTWCSPKQVIVSDVGVAIRGTKKGVILASFNAG